MRLWHKDLLYYLPKQTLLGQHRECCTLRGLSWGKKHYIVDYIFTHNYLKLTHYHKWVMKILIEKYNVNIDKNWLMDTYRGKKIEFVEFQNLPNINYAMINYNYLEHDYIYLEICLHNLKYKIVNGKQKNIDLFKHFPEIIDRSRCMNNLEKTIRTTGNFFTIDSYNEPWINVHIGEYIIFKE